MTGEDTLIHRRVEAARRGSNSTVIGRMASGWAVLGDSQFVPGYCLLLPDPVVPSLNALAGSDRERFLRDMTALGDALLEVTDAHRINYSILGNTDPALHAHVFPRYRTEPRDRIGHPVWLYDPRQRGSVPFDAERDGILMGSVHAVLSRDGLSAGSGSSFQTVSAPVRLTLSSRFAGGGTK